MIINNGKTIYLKKEIPAPLESVFALWSNAENIPLWWSPNVERFDSEIKEGKPYKIIWRDHKDPAQSPYGVFTRVVPNHCIEMTWKWDAISSHFDSTIQLAFNFTEGKTVLEFTHMGIQPLKEVESHHSAWEEILNTRLSFSMSLDMHATTAHLS